MAFVPAPNIVLCEMRYTLDTEKCENRIHVNVLHEPTPADFANLSGAISNAIITLWLPLLPATVQYRELFFRSLQSQNAPQQTFPIPAGVGIGTHGSQQLPNNVTICVSLRSTAAGRSARGRLYWPALCEDEVTNNHVIPPFDAEIVAAVKLLDENITAVGSDWQIVSFFQNKAPRPGGPVYFSVSNILLADTVVDSQRRRLPGRGQ